MICQHSFGIFFAGGFFKYIFSLIYCQQSLSSVLLPVNPGKRAVGQCHKLCKEPDLTRYLQTKSLTKTARRTLPTSLKTMKGSNSSESDPLSCAGFSLASWPRSFMASSKRDKYFWRPGRGELFKSSVARSPLVLFRMLARSSSREPLRDSLKPGRGEPLLSGVALWERLPCAEEGLGEDDEESGSVLARSRWKCGSVERREAPAADVDRQNQHYYNSLTEEPLCWTSSATS